MKPEAYLLSLISRHVGTASEVKNMSQLVDKLVS